MKKFSVIFILVVLSLIAWRPLLNPGFFIIHDNQQIVRLAQLDKSLLAGQFPVRYVPDLGFGFGYPLFNFYPPLVYYLGELFHLALRIGFIDSIKLVWFVALVGSALAMYFFAKEIFGKIGAVVAAMFYLYAPYHAVDAYVRGALAELFSFVWLPLILLFSYKRNTVLTGIFLALLMLTHNLTFLPFLGLFIIWSMAIKNWRFPISILIAFGLTAFFWLPALLEKQYTLVDQLLTTGQATYKIHFVCPEQLWNSLWGYGGSIAGCVDGLSFKVGKPHIFVAILALIIAIWKRSRLIFTLVLLFILSAFMTTQYSRFVWDNIVPLWYLQFPWRFLEFVALFSSILAGSFVLIVKKKSWQIFIAAGLIFSVIYFHGKYFVPQTYLNTTDTEQTSEEQTKWVVSSTSYEYLPKGGEFKNIQKEDLPKTKYQTISGDFAYQIENYNPDSFLLTGYSQSGATIQFAIANFPGWKVWVNGQEAPIDDNNKYKLITIKTGSDKQTITGKFTNTPPRTVGNSISVIFFINLGVILLLRSRRLSRILRRY